jgi:hypothetical protein
MQGGDGRTVSRVVDAGPRTIGSGTGKTSVRWKGVTVLAVAVFLLTTGVGRSLAVVSPGAYQSSAGTKSPTVPRVFKVDLTKGFVMYVFPYPQWQGVRVLFYRHRRGKLKVAKGVEYSVGSESGVGDPNAWPDLSAKVEAGAVSAHFGPLGSVDMHFVPAGGSRRYRPYCGGERVRLSRGHYEGTVRFAGGDGHPPVKASVAQAAPAWELEERCTGGVREGPPTLPGAQLLAGSVHPDTPSFSVFKNAPNAQSHIFAYVNEGRRGVGMSRFAGVVAPPSAFRYDQALAKATVRPPAPFSGAGFYDSNRDRPHRWFGPLAVDLPGREHVSLTHDPLRGFIVPARWIPLHPKKGG